MWFYGPDEDKPVLVDGTLEVYAFDETEEVIVTGPYRRPEILPD